MASLGKINEIVDDKAFSQVDQLTDKLNSNNQALLNNINNVLQLNAALGNSKSLPALTKEIERQQLSLQKLAQAQNRTAVTATQLDKANLSLEAAQKRAAAAQERQSKAAKDAASPFEQLTKKLREQEKAAADIGAAYGTSSVKFKEAAGTVQSLRKQIDDIEQPIGKFQRNVGNYGSAIAGTFSKAYGLIRTAANILPGLGISGIFLLAFEGLTGLLSQFDLFTDKLNSSKEILKSFNEVNKAASTEYGKQSSELRILYTAATDVTNSYEARLRAARQLQEQFPTTFKNYTAEKIITGELKTNYDQLTTSLLENAKARAAADKIAELSGKKQENDFKKAKIISAFNKEQAEVAKANRGVAAQNKQDSSEFDILGQTDVVVAATNAAREGLVNATDVSSKTRARLALREVDANNRILQNQIDFLTKYAGGNNKIADSLSQGANNTPDSTLQKDRLSAINALIEAEKNRNQLVQEDDKKSFDERLKSADQFVQKTIGYINHRKEIELDGENLTAEGRKAIVQKANNDINALRLELLKEQQKIQAEANKKYEDAQKELLKRLSDAEKAEILALQDASNQRLQIIDKETNEAKKLLLAQFANGEINTSEYNTRLFGIEQSASARRIELQIETVKKVIAAQAAGLAFGIGSNADLQKSTEDLTKLVNDSEQLKTKVVLDNAKIREDAVKNLHKLEGELAEQSLELIAKVVSARFDAQQKDLDDQSNAIDKKADKDKKDVDRSLLTSEQKADAEALIDAQATSQKEAIAQQQKDIAKEQADYEKAIGLLRIAVKTGETIFALEASAAQASAQGALLLANPLTAAFAPIAFAAAGAILAQIPFIVGQGLVQAAAVALVPGFFGGTDNAPGGLAWVGERGSELIVDPQGRTTLSPNGATLSYLQPGTQVFTHEKTVQMLSKPEKLSPAQSGGMSWDAFAKMQERQTRRLEKSMGVRVTTQKITRGGFRTIQQQNNSRTEYKNRYLR